MCKEIHGASLKYNSDEKNSKYIQYFESYPIRDTQKTQRQQSTFANTQKR